MTKSSTCVGRSQLARLLQLILFLRAGRFPNASVLASLCEVSRRTIYRDLKTLVAAGVPVGFRMDCGGYEISPGFFLESPRLEESEAVALVVQAMRTGPRTGPDRTQEAYRAVQKVAQALPEGFRDRILALVELLREEPETEVLDPDRARIHEALVDALAKKHAIRIWFRDPATHVVLATRISPTRLALEGDSWRVTGRSSLHRRVETIRVAWIVRVLDTGEASVAARPCSPAQKASGTKLMARLRFDARIAPEVLDARWPRDRQLERRDDGSLEMMVPIDDAETLTGWILGLGEHVEVLGPNWLRDRVREIARRVMHLNSSVLDRVGSKPAELEEFRATRL